MPRRFFFLIGLAAVLLVPTGTATAAKPKFVTVSFTGSGGTEKDVWSLSGTSGDCSYRGDGSVDAAGVSWKVKFKRVPLPKKGQVTFKTATATLGGSEVVKFNYQADPGCQTQSQPPVDCSVDLAGKVRSAVALRRKGRKVVATFDLFAERAASRPDEQTGCQRALRSRAYVANVRIPASGRTYRKSFDQTINDGLRPEHRGHFELDESDIPGYKGKYSFVSDVAWQARLSATYLRR